MKLPKSTIVLCFLCVLSCNLSAQTDSTTVVRVLSFNIFHGATVEADKEFDLDLLAKVIQDQKPDLVALQEVDYKTKRARGYDLVTELGVRTKMQALFGKAMPYDGGEYGEGVLSTASFLSTKNHALPARADKEPRAALAVMVPLQNDKKIRFVATHLDHTKEETDRLAQAQKLNQLFAQDETPTILAGDLNALPHSQTMQKLLGHWQNADPNNSPTYPAKKPSIKLDYILFRPAQKWRVLESKVIANKIASDHRAVLTVLELME